jgi:hypothetical protein
MFFGTCHLVRRETMVRHDTWAEKFFDYQNSYERSRISRTKLSCSDVEVKDP